MPAILSVVLAIPKILRVAIPIIDVVVKVEVAIRNGIVYALYNGSNEKKKLFVTKDDFNDPDITVK